VIPVESQPGLESTSAMPTPATSATRDAAACRRSPVRADPSLVVIELEDTPVARVGRARRSPADGDPDGPAASQPPHSVAIQIDDVGAAARTPVDELHADAPAIAAHADHASSPIPDAKLRSCGRVHPARVAVCADADTGLAIPGGRPGHVVPGRACAELGPYLADRSRGVALGRLRPRSARRLLNDEICDRPGSRARRSKGTGRGRLALTELDRVEVSGGQCRRGRWGSSGCGGRDPQRRKRAEQDQRARSSAGQTMTPMTIDSSGRR
jgi:hypothetical protein